MPDLTMLLSPLNLLFFIVVTGFAIGRIRIKGISLDIAGILFAAILVGGLMNNHLSKESSELAVAAQNTLKTFSKLGSSLFVSVIGLQTGFSVNHHPRGSMLAFAIGSLMSISGVAVMLLLSFFDKSIDTSSLLGILCGALTSTPGLSVVCELTPDGIENAVLGYGASYPCGVILAVLFTKSASAKTMKKAVQFDPRQDIKSKIYPELILIGITALCGSILGIPSLIPLLGSLGTTASTLLVGLAVGCVFCKRCKPNILSNQSLNLLKNLGLALFFTGTGFSTGIQAPSLDIQAMLYGALITLAAILCGSMLCKLAQPAHGLHQGVILAGGMTSSPAYGAISSAVTENYIHCFSFAYFGSLVSLIILIQSISR